MERRYAEYRPAQLWSWRRLRNRVRLFRSARLTLIGRVAVAALCLAGAGVGYAGSRLVDLTAGFGLAGGVRGRSGYPARPGPPTVDPTPRPQCVRTLTLRDRSTAWRAQGDALRASGSRQKRISSTNQPPLVWKKVYGDALFRRGARADRPARHPAAGTHIPRGPHSAFSTTASVARWCCRARSGRVPDTDTATLRRPSRVTPLSLV